MKQHELDRPWESAALSRIGGGAQGGSTKTPRELEAEDRRHEGRDDLDKPAGAVPPQKEAPPQEHPRQEHPAQVHPCQEDAPPQEHPPQQRAAGTGDAR
jgi:hypothetical protein